MLQVLIVAFLLSFASARPQLNIHNNAQWTPSNVAELRDFGAPALANDNFQKESNEPLERYKIPSNDNEALSGLYGAPEIKDEAPTVLYGAPDKNILLGLEISQSALDFSEPALSSGLYETPVESIRVPIIAFLDDEQNIPKGLSNSDDEPDVNLDKGRDEPEMPLDKSAMMLMPFNYNWHVRDSNSENSFGHSASSDGFITQGEYSVLLPDGRMQVVRYSDDGTGYKVKISYT